MAVPAARADVERAIVHIDVDCMCVVARGVAAPPCSWLAARSRAPALAAFPRARRYAQVEAVNNPALRGRPLGVVQKYLVVTANYEARALGVGKLMAVDEARRLCGGALALVDGSDLTPYREAADRVRAAVGGFGTYSSVGLDEVTVDVTSLATERLREWEGAVRGGGGGAGGGGAECGDAHEGRDEPRFALSGFLHLASEGTAAENRHRVMDLRASDSAPCGVQYDSRQWAALPYPHRLLCAASAVAREVRAAVREQTGLTVAAGIAHNPLLAKLSAGLHKPDAQTTLMASEASAFVAPLPVRALRGVGHATNEALRAVGIITAAQMVAAGEGRVHAALLSAAASKRTDAGGVGDARAEALRTQAAALVAAAQGRDETRVEQRGPPRAITVEDSFRECRTHAAAEGVVRALLPDLLVRAAEDALRYARRPQRLVAKWRVWTSSERPRGRSSRSEALPRAVLSALDAATAAGGAETAATPAAVDAAAALVANVLRRELGAEGGWNLTLLNVGVGSFTEAGSTKATTVVDMLGATRSTADPPARGEGAGVGAHDGSARADRDASGTLLAHGEGPAPPLHSKREARIARQGGGPVRPALERAALPQRVLAQSSSPRAVADAGAAAGARGDKARVGGDGDCAVDLGAIDAAEQRLLMRQIEQQQQVRAASERGGAHSRC